MGKFIKGEVVVVPFPFSDLTNSKRRPALVIAPLIGDDVILCQITTRARSDRYSISVESADFERGSLDHDSNIRPNRLFTADESIVIRSVGKLSNLKIDEVISKLIDIFRS